MARLSRLLLYMLASLASVGLLAVVAVAGLYLYMSPQLPSVDTLRDVRYQQPLRVYAASGEMIAEFGEYRREPVRYADIPERMKQAFIATEDERFFSHPGVDWRGMARAVLHLARHREIGPGGSTITMQTARNFFLGREQTYLRKLNEIFLAFNIERELSKEEILELYLNKIYLGQRAYGIGAASRIYYGRPPDQLTLAETAMIAGLPQAPSVANPIRNPQRALQRRAYVLRRMLETGAISQEEFAEASTAPVTAALRTARVGLDAAYVAELARAQVVTMYGDEAYTEGYRVYTTVQPDLQEAANRALRGSLLSYDERHGYRGPEASHDLSALGDDDARLAALAAHGTIAGLRPALVLAVDDEAGEARLLLGRDDEVTLDFDGARWARRWITQSRVGDAPQRMSSVVEPGHVIRIRDHDDGWRLAQLPNVEGSLVSLSPSSGAVLALAGGFDFRHSQFNRATQALRQPGSAFKPFIYAAALERGFTPASIVNDAPVVFEDAALETAWRPENYSGRFYGPTRLREALAQSRNLVSIRVLRDIGIRYGVTFLDRFGFPGDRMPADLSLALGSAAVTPLELTTAYAVFANGGYRVQPHVISRIENDRGDVVYRTVPTLACEDCTEVAARHGLLSAGTDNGDGMPVLGQRFVPAERVLPADNAYQMSSMMQDVITRGTGRAARSLGRSDLAGKTGTTNDLHDAWFAGFNGEMVTTAWVGFDQARSLGQGETGARTALPMWIDYMAYALREVPEAAPSRPAGMVTVRIDPGSGLVTSADNPQAMFETFRDGQVPDSDPNASSGGSSGGSGGGSRSGGSLF
ncbi:penicillin-binding protein 1A [Natronocella acetinitrilica]|uniref:Penicillin-binding protein 1A n=1 Tax=Natronocella acetinitrilica TaxID=414046 RepID=A0AAE3KI07_9GAMM|nr:penicillin-binding protein 1A [Natronocella acetinitrilica]MCP1676882.1 penicillin-binding protein 1A [Natronocella acetinitrilica]